MLGEEERSEEEGSFSKASIPKRIAIVLAGGLVNIVFGLTVYFILMSSTGNYISNIVDETLPQYNEQISVLQQGDEILEINDKKIRLNSDIREILNNSNGESVKVTIKRNDEIKEFDIKPFEIKSVSTGIYFGVAGENISTEIAAIYPNSPAEEQGLQISDNILKVNGVEAENDPYKVVEEIEKSNTGSNNVEDIVFTIDRRGEIIDITVTPDIISNYYLGVTFEQASKSFLNNIYYGFWDTVDFSTSIIDNLKMIFTGGISSNQLMGPIGISGVVADTNTFAEFMNMLALVSLSLGVTNLLPFPPLDGGKIVILIIEGIRRKPMKENIEIGIQMLGFALLIALSIYVAYNDILRIL